MDDDKYVLIHNGNKKEDIHEDAVKALIGKKFLVKWIGNNDVSFTPMGFDKAMEKLREVGAEVYKAKRIITNDYYCE